MEGCDISKYFGYFVKTATQVRLSASMLWVYIGDDYKGPYEGPFAPERFKLIPETDELFVHVSQLLDKSCKGLLSLVSQQYK